MTWCDTARIAIVGSAPLTAALEYSLFGSSTRWSPRVFFSSLRGIRDTQKTVGHQGAGSQDMAAESCRTAPGRSSVTSPASASVPSLVPPR